MAPKPQAGGSTSVNKKRLKFVLFFVCPCFAVGRKQHNGEVAVLGLLRVVVVLLLFLLLLLFLVDGVSDDERQH